MISPEDKDLTSAGIIEFQNSPDANRLGARFSLNDPANARHYLISLVTDEKAKKAYANWWSPFKRVRFRWDGNKFISVVRKEMAAESGNLAGKTEIKAALAEYVAGTGKK